MSNRYSFDDLKKYVQSKGGDVNFEEKDYKGLSQKYLFTCDQGHIWEQIAGRVKKGSWCPTCLRKVSKDLEFLQNYAESHGGYCRSDEFISMATRYTWECKEGHRWRALGTIATQGTWCKDCAYTNSYQLRGKENGLERLKKIAESLGGKCLDLQYTKQLDFYNFECKNGHSFTKMAKDIFVGFWCPQCKKNQPITLQQAQEVAEKNGGRLVSETFSGGTNKHIWECEHGHQWSGTYSDIKNCNSWCPTCKESHGEREISNILTSLGVKYEKQFVFEGCKNERDLPFDFFLPDYNTCIEYDGGLHFKETKWTTSEEFELIKKREEIKNKFCKENSINLLRIPYLYFNRLREILTQQLNSDFKTKFDFENSILICWGCRPERNKLLSLKKEFEDRNMPVSVLFSGQHCAIEKYQDFDYNCTLRGVKEGKGRLNSISSIYGTFLSNFLISHPYIKHVVCQGDTLTALVTAQTSFNLGVNVWYIESGLRSNSLTDPFPEEGYRRMISSIATVNFCPTQENLSNLISEKCIGDCYVVGNTGLDLLEKDKPVTYGNKVVVTLHRRENLNKLFRFFMAINNLAIEFPEFDFILPIHYNPEIRKLSFLLTKVEVIEPLEQKEFLELVRECRIGISDSGGLQEDFSFYKKKLILLRKTTERPEAIGLTSFYCPEPEDIRKLFIVHSKDCIPEEHDCPFGDGFAAQKIVDIIQEKYINK